MDAMIRFENVSKIYGVGDVAIHAVDHINFEIGRGEFCVIVGPSGAGKTLFLSTKKNKKNNLF